MYNEYFSENSLRSKSALEVAIQARAKEKEMAMLAAEIGAEEARGRKASRGSLRSMLTSLLSAIVK